MKLNIDEALRLMGVRGGAPAELRRETSEAAERLKAYLRPKYLYRVFPLDKNENGYALADAGIELTGSSAEKMLGECSRAALLVCTLGQEFDALLRKEQARDMSRAVMLDACGSVWVESGCDEAERELKKLFPDSFLTDRFSPGYGDLPLGLQPSLCSALDAEKRLGVHVTDSLLMNPCKTVTAVVGIADRPQPAKIRGCACCSMNRTCGLKKEGKSCAE